MKGYDDAFLGGGIVVPHPTFSSELDPQILRRPNVLREEIYSDHPNYTVVMNRDERTAAYVAVNIDQKSGERWQGELDDFDDWRPDPNIGADHQLDDDYYDIPGVNTYHKGHLARRLSVAFGDTKEAAQQANNDTYYYSNRALQHRFYNPDEWLKLEEWARTLDLDASAVGTGGFGSNLGDSDNEIDYNHRVCSFSGPIYGDTGRVVRYNNVVPANVPAAFFKIICFRHKDSPSSLSVRAYIVPQDSLAMRSKASARRMDLTNYQVSIRLIEDLTGLVFADEIAVANPIFFGETAEAKTLGVTRFPELVEVDTDTDIIDPGQRRPTVNDRQIDVVILAALVNPAEDEAENEWISVANLSARTEKLDGWKLVDRNGRTLELSGQLGPGEARRFQPIRPISLANGEPGFIKLFDEDGNRIDRVRYTKSEARREGHPVVFYDERRRLLDDTETFES